jgi:hypothetical protein
MRVEDSMAQIFISHSARDQELKNFFNQAFATSSVYAKYEEIEQLYKGTITTEMIQQDITFSNAVLVLLSQNVDSLDHTRDWIGYEVGYAKGAQGGNKDVWVFEHVNDAGQLTKVIPNFDHYVVYDESDTALMFMKAVVESYDDGRVLRNVAVGTGLGAMVGMPWIGAGVAAVYSNLSTGRPVGIETICGCSLKYRIHLPEQMTQLRCPKCRNWYYRPSVNPQLP